MKWQTFENKIKTALSGHRSEVDVDEIWAAIEPQVDAINRRKKRRGFFLWFCLAGAVLAGSAMGFFQKNNDESGPLRLSKTPVAALKQEPSGENIAKPPVEVQDESNENTAGQPGSVLTENKPDPVLNHIPAIAPHSNRERSQKEQFFKNMEPQQEAAPASQLPVDSAAIAEQNETTPGLDFLPGLRLVLLDLPETNLPYRPAPALPEDLETPKLRLRSFSLDLAFQGSVSFVDRKLKADSVQFKELLTLRNKTERELEAVQAGLWFTVRHKIGLGLTSGMNFTQINERFNYNASVTTVDTVYGIKHYVITINNDTVPFYDDIPLERTTKLRKVYYNKYRMIDIPVLVGYRHTGRNFSVGAQAGIFVNMYLSTRGRYLKSESEVIDISNSGIFRNTVGMSFYFGASAGYYLNRNLEVTVSPFMQMYAKSFTASSYGISQDYKLYGLNAGLVYHFD